MSTPEQLLADRSWRWRHSIYTLWALVACGFISLLYTGVRARRTDWMVWGAVWGVVVTAALVGVGSLAPDNPEDGYSVGALVAFAALFFGWEASAVDVFMMRKDWLPWKAAKQANPWYQPPEGVTPPAAVAATDRDPLGLDDPRGQYLAPGPAIRTPPPPGAGLPGLTTPPPPPPPGWPPAQPGPSKAEGPVDLNTATIQEIAELPGVGVASAQRIVDERTRRGGFDSVDEAAVAADLAPHLWARLRHDATTSPRPKPPRRGRRGRVIDV